MPKESDLLSSLGTFSGVKRSILSNGLFWVAKSGGFFPTVFGLAGFAFLRQVAQNPTFSPLFRKIWPLKKRPLHAAECCKEYTKFISNKVKCNCK